MIPTDQKLIGSGANRRRGEHRRVCRFELVALRVGRTRRVGLRQSRLLALANARTPEDLVDMIAISYPLFLATRS